MPFGLKNAAQSFLWLTDTVLQRLFVYLDNILVASHSKSEYSVHIRQVLEGSQQNDLIINLSKCQFGWLEIDFLGQGAIPLPSKVATIKELTKPSTIKGLQRSSLVWYQGVYQDLDNHGTTGAFWCDTFLPSFGASSSKLNATSLPSPDSEAHGTMVERGDVNSIQFCKGGTSHSRLPSPRCPTLGPLGSRATLLPYLKRHQHQIHRRKEHIRLMLCLIPSSMQ